MKHLEFNRSPKQALSARDNKPRTSRSTLSICGTPYFSGSYSPSTGVPPPQWKKNNRSSTLSIFHSQRTPFYCFPFVFLLSPGFWYIGFGTNRIVGLVFVTMSVLKQLNLQVSGGKATLVARVLLYVRAAQEILEPEDDAQSDSSEMGDFIEHSYEVLFVPDTDVECVIVHSK